jgi:DNA-binding CsgD family transcriptional regulator
MPLTALLPATTPGLHGRGAECAAVDDLLAAARSGRAGSLVLTGDPGIGRTALLRYAAAAADGMLVLHAHGVPAEAELSYAGLLELVRPVLGEVAALPGPQAAALGGALGLTEAPVRNRFLIAVGLLGLLGELAGRQPVLCLVDDAQWLDAPSLDALLFVAHRVRADRIAIVLAVRGAEPAPGGLAELPLAALDPDAAEALLAERGVADDGPAGRRLLALAAGNPLALVELSGLPGSDRSVRLSARLERAFLSGVRDLAPDVRRFLLLAAAEDSPAVSVLLAAADRLGIAPGAIAAAESAGSIRLAGARLEFTHPLIRAAVYQTATLAGRQDVHRALAAVLDGGADAGRRAWHRAAAAIFPDEQAAADLERAGQESRRRAAHAAAAAALERAAELTADPDRRPRLLLDAAEEAWATGDATAAAALLDRIGRVDPGSVLLGRLDQLRGGLEIRRGDVLDGYEILAAGADRIAEFEPVRAAGMLADALQAASYGGDLARVAAAGRRAARLAVGKPSIPAAAFAAGVGAVLGGAADRGARSLRAVVAAGERTDDPLRLTWAGCAAAHLGDVDTARAYGLRAVARCRATAALSNLPYALELVSTHELPVSPAATEQDSAEGLRLARETGQPALAAVHLSLLAMAAAYRGDEAATAGYADEVATLAARHGLALPHARATAALGVLDLLLGRPDRALDRLGSAAVSGHPILALYRTADLVEAAVRVDRRDRAVAAVARFEAWAVPSGSPWATAMLARCRGLLSTGAEAATHFEAALAAHARSGAALPRAHTQLLYGELLRRERRRAEARPHLRDALETFDRLGTRPWAERARAELRASGETARRRDGDGGGLTPQERQVARLVAAGASTKDVAAQLYVSPRTVDSHLRGVFAKLGVSSRGQLAQLDLTA